MVLDTKTDRPYLHRSRRDHVVFGVCGGLGDYFNLDPTIIRLAFVLITLAGGAGFLAYIILAIILPQEGAEPVDGQEVLHRNLEDLRTRAREVAGEVRDDLSSPTVRPRHWTRSQELAGIVLIGVGVLFMAGNLGWFAWVNWSIFWPLLLVLLGVAILLRHYQEH